MAAATAAATVGGASNSEAMNPTPAIVVIEVALLGVACLWLGVRRGWIKFLLAHAVALDRRLVALAGVHLIASLLLGVAVALLRPAFGAGSDYWWAIWTFMCSFLIAQAGLMATWAALGPSSWKARLAGLFLGASCLAEASRPDRLIRLELFSSDALSAFGIIVIIECSVLILLLAICRWRRRRLVWLSQGSLQASKPQISLLGAIIGVVLIAVYLSVFATVRAASDSFRLQIVSMRFWELIGMLSWVLIPLVGLWATLTAKNPLLRIPVPILVAAGFTFLHWYCRHLMTPSRGVPWSVLLAKILIPNLVPALLVLGTLLLVRSWGYRLIETKECAAAAGKAADRLQNKTQFGVGGPGSAEAQCDSAKTGKP